VATYLQSGNIANVSVAGNVTATYFVGNGALLTGIVGGASNYGNVDVRNFLKTGDGASRLIQGYYANIDLGATARLFSFGATAKSYFGHDGQLGNASINWVRADNGDVRISTNNAAYNWIFDRTGNLTLPYGAIIRDSSINTLAIGTDAGNVTNTQNGAIAIGYLAGSDAQNYDAVAIGSSAGGGGSGYYSPQGQEAVAVGSGAGMQSQGIYTVAVGSSAGGNLQSTWGVAVGHLAGETIQGIGAVAFGASAGYIGQGAYAVAIGNKAGVTNQGNNSIIINATGNVLNQTTANTFTVAPIRTDSGNTAQALYYNTLTKEITYANVTAGGSNYGNVNVAAYLNTQGYNLYSNVNVANYLTTATITTTGNITAANFVGNISITGNVTGTSSNVTLQAGAYTSVFDNQGNVTVPQLFTAGNVQTTGYLFGNGAFLTGIVAGSSYSNVQVATYLPTYSGVVGASNVFVSGNVTAQYFLGNGALLTGIASSYSNVQVATYLPTYTGNVANVRLGTSGILTFSDGTQQTTAAFGGGGNYGNANVAAFLPTYTGTTGITQIGTLATLSVSGNATVGNLVGTEANTRIIANTYVTTFDIYGNVSFPANVIATNFVGSGSLLSGVAIKTTGSWTVPTGNSTQSFTVASGTYQLWVDCNIPNGILAWNATATVTNSNVPVVGVQYAWVYNGGGTPIDFTSIPNQFVGTGNTIVRSSVSPSATTNRFDFGLNNTSGGNVTVSYGYVKIS
jgi:hypothetical protein